MLTPRALVVLTLTTAIACGDSAEFTPVPDGITRSMHGDTSIVSTSGNGAWGPARDAIEVKRIGGGSKETTFGAVSILAATPDGGVILVDSKSADGLIVRQFNADGEFVRNIGRHGTGPGEYSELGQILLAVHPNGTIVLRDGARAINRYGPDGKLISGFTLGLPNAGSLDLVAGIDGSVYVRGPFPRRVGPGQQHQPAMLRFDTAGQRLDSITGGGQWLPGDNPPSSYTPGQVWYVHPDGRVYVIRSDKLGFLITDPTRAKPPLIGEHVAPPVAYLADEHAELQAVDDFKQRTRPPGQRAPAVKIPKNKMPAGWAMNDVDGRIWIFRRTTGEKVAARVVIRTGPDSAMVTFADRPVFAAFKPDGTYLGEIRFPMGAFPTFVGNTAWATVPGEDDVPVLVKYRIHDAAK